MNICKFLLCQDTKPDAKIAIVKTVSAELHKMTGVLQCYPCLHSPPQHHDHRGILHLARKKKWYPLPSTFQFKSNSQVPLQLSREKMAPQCYLPGIYRCSNHDIYYQPTAPVGAEGLGSHFTLGTTQITPLSCLTPTITGRALCLWRWDQM